MFLTEDLVVNLLAVDGVLLSFLCVVGAFFEVAHDLKGSKHDEGCQGCDEFLVSSEVFRCHEDD